MALPSEAPRSFRLYVTHVDGEGHFLKISGQLDQQSSLMIESLFETALENLEKGVGSVPPAAIHEGIICAAKYKDGTYYRAKIINTTNLATGLVGVHFIDYGNKDIISLSTIRLLDSYEPMFLQLRGQASDYYLSRVKHLSGRWDEPLLLKLQSLLCYAEYPAVVEAQTRTLPIISIQFKGNDLSTHLVSNRIGIAIPVPQQEGLILQMMENQQGTVWSPTLLNDAPSFTEHVPFLINQNFPNPASAMRLNQNMGVQYNGAPVSVVGQRLLVNKASRNMINIRAPARQPQIPSAQMPMNSTPPPILINKPPSPKKLITYKSRLLEVNSQHKVFISFAEEGPELFAIQLVSDSKKLQDMMDDINKRPHSSLTEPPMIGTVCLGRMSGDRIICRAIVMNLSGSQCKLFFVDFGDTEMVSYYDIFDIPEEFVKPNVFAMRFCLSGVKKLEKSPNLTESFKQLVNGKVLTLRVVSPEGPPLIQYGQLFFEDKNVLDLLTSNIKDNLQFKWMEMLPLGSKQSVLVSYVDSCVKFYMQLSDKIDELGAVMKAVKAHCETSSSPGELPVGAVCCARFPDDKNWYRALVRETKGNKIIVAYVDYGNEQEVHIDDLRTITPDLIRLPAQAMKCALRGFENRPVETKTSNQLEMLALEKTLMAHIAGVLSSDTMLVSLVDHTVNPPLDVARRMNQLSQPRTSETKPTTPIRKDAPETFSSPEESIPDERKTFRREKSFREERNPREGEEFGQRGGSFRARDQKDNFDRSGPGRHSEKYGAKPERGDRRGRAGGEEWDRDRRKPKEQQEKKSWKKDTAGVGKRLKQAVEAASLDAAPAQHARLKRDNRFNQDEEVDDRGNRNFRTERRDNRGEGRRDNWGEKKESWNQKREFRDNRSERGERMDKMGRNDRGERSDRAGRNDRGGRYERGGRGGRSNFTPRDRAERAERSFTMDSDKRSERSFRSQDSGSGRAPPYKNRSKFTQVQYKELANPIPLETSFTEPSVELESQHEVSVTWIISPENFYTQILSLQPKFLEMMHKIPELYKGVKSYTGNVPIGASVLARYPSDGVLYRATVVAVQPFSKFIVRYVDFGNKQLVDAKDIWQMESELMELPKMAVHCSLTGVSPQEGEWKADPEIDLCFNAPRYQCVFQQYLDDQFKVTLWNNGVSVADLLVEKQLAVLSENLSNVTLKDEPIDLTIIVGQQILCKVTFVESFEKFYVQLDLDKSNLVETAIANYDISKLMPLAAESLTEGIHCTVKHEDKIYRAIINDASDKQNIQLVLPDYGRTINTSSDNVMILPTDFSVYYYQSLQCSLNNYNENSKTLLSLDELKEKLTGNKFIIFINEVEEITLLSTLYDVVTGKKIAIFEPDEGAYEEVVQICTRAVFNYNFGNAYISHIENLNEFYVQKSLDGDKIAHLLEELYNFYEEGTPEPLIEFETDSLCAAKSSDGNWYRATILSATESEVKVQFTDYGNSESLPKDSVKKLDAKFFDPCDLALVASLGLVALQADTLTKLTEWTTEKEIQVTLAFGSDGWLANLYLDGVDLPMRLINEKLAAPQVNTPEIVEEPKTEITLTADPVSLPEGCQQVYISHIDTPGQFWLQMADKMENIEEIQAELQANAESYSDIDNREMGTLCVAKYLADDLWYRAEILDSDSDITTIRFIDYGNTDVLDNQPGLIKTIPDNLKEVERYAIKSSVNAVPTGTGQWSEPASDFFTQLVGDISVPVDASIVLKDVTTYVDIYVHGLNLTDKLVCEGYATKSEEAVCGNLPSCFASHVNSPSEFWIQLETAAPELQAMEAAMVDAENFPELTEREEGVICAAKYPEDEAWYRAQVIVDGSEGTEVLFMDYGNASIASELRSLPDDLKVKPALSRKCALQKPRDIKSWSRKSEIKFNELAAEGATIFNVQFIASGDISIVDLYLEGKSVTEELVELCEELPISERPTPVGQDVRSSGKICFVNSLDEFYVQLDDLMPNLDKVTDLLSKSDEFEPVSELKVGSLCAAFWSDDEQWYRAKVLEFCDVGYHVQFVDYGNKAKCEEFKQLPEIIAVIEPLAKCCRLAGFANDTSNESAKAKLEDLVAELVTFQIEFLDSFKEPSLVRLLLNDTDISSILISDSPDLKVEDDCKSNVEPQISVPEIDSLVTKNVVTDQNVNSNKDKPDLDSIQNDLDDSIDSTNTVIEMSFEEKNEDSVASETSTLETNVSTEIIENTITISTSPETEDLKEPLQTEAEHCVDEIEKAKESSPTKNTEIDDGKK